MYSVGTYLLYFLNSQSIVSVELSDIVVVLAFLPTLYYLLIYFFVVRQVGQAYALIIGLFVTAIPISLGFALDGGYSSIHASISIVLMFVSALIGPVAIFALGWIHIMGYILAATGTLGDNTTENGLLFLLAYAGAGLGGWLMFHRNYTHESHSVSEIRHALHEEQIKSAALLAALGDGIVVINAQGNIQLCNDVALDYLEMDRSATLHHPYTTLFTHATHQTNPSDKLANALATMTPLTLELISIQQEDHHQPRDLSATIRPLTNENGDTSAYMMILHDISSFSRAERLKNDFITMAGHELRTPMTVIAGYSDLLLNPTFGHLNKEQLNYVKRTKQTTEQLIHLVNNMLDIIKLEGGHQNSNPETLDITLECRKSIASFHHQFKQKNIRVASHFPSKTISVQVDKALLQQALSNLMANAHTYSKPDSTVTMNVESDDTVVTVSVADSGPGIKPDKQLAVFDKFSRQNIDTSAEGTGLGLAITREIVTSWGGIINVESDGKHGSRFYFTIPRHTNT